MSSDRDPRSTQGIGTLFRPIDDLPTLTDHARSPFSEPGAVERAPHVAPSSEPNNITLRASLPKQESGEARYAVQSILGRGGMGEVRLCRDERIGREIAVKVMLPPVQGADEARARFIREARVQGQLEHPAIVPVHEVEVFDDGTAYFTMKRVRGQTLSSVIASLARGDEEALRRFTRRTLLQAFATVCLAVDFAHKRGVVHRDLKPQNIMLGDFGEVYVLDWGVAKLLDAGDSEDLSSPGRERPSLASDVDGGALASRAGTILGTPGYMAPEQLDASSAGITSATDVYALGAILFEILTWTPVAAAGTDPLEIVVQTLHGVDGRAAHRAPARAISAELEALCVRALALKPEDRFPSARALWAELDRHLEGEQDVERRRAQSTAHAQAAEQLVAGAGPDEDDPRRTSAYGELSRALALDPGNEAARRALVTLLTAPSQSVPPEVAARIRGFEDSTERLGARLNTPIIFPWLALLPVALWAGVRDWLAIAAILVPLALVSALSGWLARQRRQPLSMQVVSMLLTFSSYFALSWVFGPFVVAPALFAMFAVTMQAHPRAPMRKIVLVTTCVAVLLALVHEYVTGASYRFENGTLILQARALEIARAPMFLLVGAGTLAAILFTTSYIGQVRARLADAERALVLQAWRLERLVPK